MDLEYQPKMIGVSDLARMLGVSQRTVYRRLRSGVIPRRLIHWWAGNLGGKIMTFELGEVETWIAVQKREADPDYKPPKITWCTKAKSRFPGY